MTDAASVDRTVSGDVERLRRERPFVRPFVDPFLGLLLARPGLVERLSRSAPGRLLPDPDPARLVQGACLEPRDEFPLDRGDLERGFADLHQVLVDGFRDARTDLLHIGRAATEDPAFLSGVARDMLGDRHDALLRAAHGLGVDARVLGFWAIQLLTPLAMARGRLLGGRVPDEAWNRGYCPVCGSWPGIARRSGAARELTCSFCATIWRFGRQECPFCEAPGPAGPVYGVPGFTEERVSVCRRCGHYLAEIEGETLAGLAPEVAALALAPLELLARQHGHAPATMDWRQMIWL
jgi:FdhE protein